jgi:hypothetical protein
MPVANHRLDANQTLINAYDATLNRFRVDAEVQASFGDLEIAIHNEEDDILVYGQDSLGDNYPLRVNINGQPQIDILSSALPTGAATEAKQDVGNSSLISLDGKISNNYGVSTAAVRTASQIGNTLGSADFNSGLVSSQTLRVTQATDIPITIIQSIPDNLNLNSNIQVNDIDVSNSNPVPISDAGSSITVDGTISALQSGTWNITNITGTISLPTGAATESTLTSIDAGIPVALGQTTMSASMPVVIPSDQTPPDFVTQQIHLLNAGSKLMNVNGSITPVKFSLAPTVGLTYFVESISLLLSDVGTMDYGDFGSIAGALANGLLFSVKTKGNIYQITNVVDNMDLALNFKSDALAGAGAAATGYFNDVDFFVGNIIFDNPIILKNSNADEIYAEVRDNLTGIDNLRCVVKYRRAS